MTEEKNTLLDFFSAIAECEQRYPVSQWSVNGVPVWPMARIEGRAELLLQSAPHNDRREPIQRRIARLLRHAASPALLPLQNYHDWEHETLLLRPVDALFLGDGVSQDFVDGAWQDRYCAPVIEALAECGASSLLMQPNVQKLPRRHNVYSAHWIASWGGLLARTLPRRNVHLPDYEMVRNFLRHRGFTFSVLERTALEIRGMRVSAMARLFESVLARTRPKLGFAVSYYWDMGFAFNLACKRRGVWSVDIQHGAQGGFHEAYNLWSTIPTGGYSILPSIFWNWSEDDARAINTWAGKLAEPWHRGIWGGHPQLTSWLNDKRSRTASFDDQIARLKQRNSGSFDVLVALQSIDGYGAVWDNLAAAIQSSPVSWRWWLRRHPSPAYNRNENMKTLLDLNRPNLIIEEASSLPLPAILANVDAVLSLMSSTAIEAQYFGHRPIFLTEDARVQLPALFKANGAEVITSTEELLKRLEAMAQNEERPKPRYQSPDIKNTAQALLHLAGTSQAK